MKPAEKLRKEPHCRKCGTKLVKRPGEVWDEVCAGSRLHCAGCACVLCGRKFTDAERQACLPCPCCLDRKEGNEHELIA